MPDEFGLSHIHLNCFQSYAKELLVIGGRHDVIEVFVQPLSAVFTGSGIVADEFPLRRGVALRQQELSGTAGILALLNEHGHCFVRYQTFTTWFSAYCGIFHAHHWALLFDVEDGNIHFLIESGHPSHCNQYKGSMTVSQLEQLIENRHIDACASLQCSSDAPTWEEEWDAIRREAVIRMERAGLEAISQFTEYVSEGLKDPHPRLLDELDFYLYFFRKPRELLRLAADRGALPRCRTTHALRLAGSEACAAWQTASRYLLKWSLLRRGNYREPVVQAMRRGIESEKKILDALSNSSGV